LSDKQTRNSVCLTAVRTGPTVHDIGPNTINYPRNYRKRNLPNFRQSTRLSSELIFCTTSAQKVTIKLDDKTNRSLLPGLFNKRYRRAMAK